MRIRYHFDDLPAGMTAAVVEQPERVVILMDRSADQDELARVLSETVSKYVAKAWMHIGVLSRQDRESLEEA